MDLTIRKMTIKDLDAVSNLEKESFSVPWSLASFEDTLDKEYYAFYVAYNGAEHIATAGMTYTKPEADISNVCVKASYKCKGVATKLLTFMMNEAKNEGITEFTLEVRAQNEPAIKLYEKLGFVSEGIRKNFYTNPADDAMIMWKR